MEITLTYFGKVNQDGEVKVHRAKEMRELIRVNYAGKEIEISIKRKRKRRTLTQNAYLHVLFTMFTDNLNDLGNTFTMPEIKEMLKYKFLKVDVYNEQTGEKVGERIKGTSELSTVETMELIENIIRYGAQEFNFQLPLPNEQLIINLKN